MFGSTNIVGMWDHMGMVHVSQLPCPSMRDGGAGVSFDEVFYLAMNNPAKICPDCVARNKAAHDEFMVMMTIPRDELAAKRAYQAKHGAGVESEREMEMAAAKQRHPSAYAPKHGK